jgi:hypothetical protein
MLFTGARVESLNNAPPRSVELVRIRLEIRFFDESRLFGCSLSVAFDVTCK